MESGSNNKLTQRSRENASRAAAELSSNKAEQTTESDFVDARPVADKQSKLSQLANEGKRPATQPAQLKPPAVAQMAFDAEGLSGDINVRGASVTAAGGSTGETFEVRTTGENARFFIKITNKDVFFKATQLAQALGLAVPDAVVIPKAGVSAKLVELNAATEAKLAAKEHVIAFERVPGVPFDPMNAPDLTPELLTQLGEIASYDMLIGKTDLFENFDPLGDGNEFNYANILFHDGRAIEIDLDGTPGNSRISFAIGTRLEVIDRIIAAPATIDRFVSEKIVGFLEMSRGYSAATRLRYERNALRIQKGMMRLVARTRAEHGEHLPEADEMIREFAERSEAAAAAILTIDARIDAITGELAAPPAPPPAPEPAQQEPQQGNRQGRRRNPCYITSACVEHKNLPDDCHELTVLRNFRDNYLINLEYGEEMIGLYYKHAPQILKGIQAQPNSNEVLNDLFLVIQDCVHAIENGDNSFAFQTYNSMVRRLWEEYGALEVIEEVVTQ